MGGSTRCCNLIDQQALHVCGVQKIMPHTARVDVLVRLRFRSRCGLYFLRLQAFSYLSRISLQNSGQTKAPNLLELSSLCPPLETMPSPSPTPKSQLSLAENSDNPCGPQNLVQVRLPPAR